MMAANFTFLGIAVGLSCWMISEWRQANVEARVKDQDVVYLTAAVQAHGIKIPHPLKDQTETSTKENDH